jgi:heme-degrading monooxygenase HmoA
MAQDSLCVCIEKGETPMLAWLNHLKVQPGKIKEFRRIYKHEIVPILKAQEGTINLFLIELNERGDEFISLIMWGNKTVAERYQKSGQFSQLTNKLQHILVEPATGKSYEVESRFR